MRYVILAAVLIAAAGSAQAQVYRCADSKGKVTFSDSPCAASQSSTTLDIRPNTVDSTGSREQMLLHEMKKLRSEVNRMQQEAQRQPQYGRTTADLQADRADSFACKQATRSYELEEGSAKREAVGSKRRAMYAACGMREPDSTVNTPIIIVK